MRSWDPGTLTILNPKGLWVTEQKRVGRGEEHGEVEDPEVPGGGTQQSGLL